MYSQSTVEEWKTETMNAYVALKLHNSRINELRNGVHNNPAVTEIINEFKAERALRSRKSRRS